MVNMIDNMSSVSKNVTKQTEVLTSALERFNLKCQGMLKSGTIMFTAGKTIAQGVLAPVGAIFETSNALGELASVGIENLDILEKSAKDFSSTFAGTTKAQFIRSAYDIKSGISSLTDEGVAKFTEFAGMTAAATKSTTDEMTTLFAMGYGIYKDFYGNMSDFEFGEMFSSGISSAVQKFRTTGSEMAGAISRLGATATSANVPFEEQLSILGMLQQTMSGSEAGTKYTSFLVNAGKAADKLGLSFLDANANLLPMTEVLGMLKNKYGETLDAIEKQELKEAFGTDEAVKVIELLYSKTDILKNNVVDMYGSMGQGIATTREMADAINGTDGNKYKVLQQNIANLKEEIGKNMLPILNQLLEKSLPIIENISGWIEQNGQLVGALGITGVGIGTLIMVLGGLKVAFGGIGWAISGCIKAFKNISKYTKEYIFDLDGMKIRTMLAGDSIKKSFNSMKKGIGIIVNPLKKAGLAVFDFGKKAFITAATKMPALISSCWSFTVALLSNPITWVVVGIIALIAVIVLLWQNWDKVSGWIKNTWSSVVEKCMVWWDSLKNKLAETPNWLLWLVSAFVPFIGLPLLIIKNWDVIKEFFSNLWVNLKEKFQAFKENFLPSLLNFGANIMHAIGQGIKSALNVPWNWLKKGFEKVRNLLPFSDAKEGPLSNLTLSGSRINTTIAEGMELTKNAPYNALDNGFSNIDVMRPFSFEIPPIDNPNFRNFEDFDNDIKDISLLKDDVYSSKNSLNFKELLQTETIKSEKIEGKENTTIINLNVDIKNLKDLKTVMSLANELQDEKAKIDEENRERQLI